MFAQRLFGIGSKKDVNTAAKQHVAHKAGFSATTTSRTCECADCRRAPKRLSYQTQMNLLAVHISQAGRQGLRTLG